MLTSGDFMKQLVPLSAPALPALVTAASERRQVPFLEFFAANIRNPHTRRAYSRAASDSLAWCGNAWRRVDRRSDS